MRFWGLRMAVFKGSDDFIGKREIKKRSKGDQRMSGGYKDSLRFPFLKGLARFFQ
jgi:hypothetical protein